MGGGRSQYAIARIPLLLPLEEDFLIFDILLSKISKLPRAVGKPPEASVPEIEMMQN
jgi:hypothetical protein